MRPLFKTLSELRQDLAVSLGFGAASGMIELQIPILTQFLQQSQAQLWRDVRWRHLLRTHVEDLGVGQRVLDLPDGFSIGELDAVYKSTGSQWSMLRRGMPIGVDLYQSGCPEAFEVSARYAGDAVQIEFWPLPEELISVRVDYYAAPARFIQNQDRASVPDDLLLTLAVVMGKGHYRQPDVQLYADRFDKMLRHAKAENFGVDGEIRHVVRDPYSNPVWQ